MDITCSFTCRFLFFLTLVEKKISRRFFIIFFFCEQHYIGLFFKPFAIFCWKHLTKIKVCSIVRAHRSRHCLSTICCDVITFFILFRLDFSVQIFFPLTITHTNTARSMALNGMDVRYGAIPTGLPTSLLYE